MVWGTDIGSDKYTDTWKSLRRLGVLYDLKPRLFETKNHFQERMRTARRKVLTRLQHRGVNL